MRPAPDSEKPDLLRRYLDRYKPTVQRYFPVPKAGARLSSLVTMAGKILPYGPAAVVHLRRADPALARIIDAVGPFRMARRPEAFQALARAIISQQLAGRAALAIYQRFAKLFPGVRFPTPRQVADATQQTLKSVGLSRQKILYLKDLAARIADGKLNFRHLGRMEDEAVVAQLTRVKGIGRWTAEIFLMFTLGRPDVLPADDLGLRNAVASAYGMRAAPTAKELRLLAERWRPYRSAAVWYFWLSTRVNPMGGEASAAKSRRQNSKSGSVQRAKDRQPAQAPENAATARLAGGENWT